MIWDSYLPPVFAQTIRPFQRNAFRKIMDWGGSALVSFDPGMGKSPTALALFFAAFKRSREDAKWPDAGPLLITCEKTKVREWEREIYKWLQIPLRYIWTAEDKQKPKKKPNSADETVVVNKKRKQAAQNNEPSNNNNKKRKMTQTHQKVDLSQAQVAIVSHSALHKSLAELQARGFRTLICDESHNFKHEERQKSQALKKLAQSCKYRLLLTATPWERSVADLYFQLHLVRPDLFRSFDEFVSKYCNVFQSKKKNASKHAKVYVNKQTAKELHTFLIEHVMVRASKQKELADTRLGCVREKVILEPVNSVDELRLLAAHEKHTRDMNQANLLYKNRDEDKLAFERKRLYGELAREVIAVKEPAVIPWLRARVGAWLDENKQTQVVLFAHHKSLVRRIRLMLESLEIRHVCVDGTIKTEKGSQALLDQFQAQKVRVAVLSLKKCKAGIDLTKGNKVVICELPHNGTDLEQAESRCDRMGQKQKVNVFYLLLACDHEKGMYNMAMRKLQDAARVLDGK